MAQFQTTGNTQQTGGRGGRPDPSVHGEYDPAAVSDAGRLHGRGLVARFAPIRGVTPKDALEHAFRLPVLLNSVTVSKTALHNEYDTLSAGQFSEAPQGGADATQLEEIPLDTLTMDWEPSWFVVTRQDPLEIRRRLNRIHDMRAPVALLIVRHPHKPGFHPIVRRDVTFRSLTEEERPGEADTRYISIDIKQWRSASSERQGHHKPGLPTTHRLKAGDTLRSLAKLYYGSYADWREIRKANHISDKWGGDSPLVKLPGRWKVGAKVTIPVVAKKNAKQNGLHKSVRSDRVGRH